MTQPQAAPLSAADTEPLFPSPALRERDGAQRPGEGESRTTEHTIAPPRSHPPRRIPGQRLALDIHRCLNREFLPLHPRDLLAPNTIATVNRLLIRGGRFLAVPSHRPAKPFPLGVAVTARQAVHALYRLLVRIDPRILDHLPP